MTVYILMGVAGCGKSTIGREAAKQLNIPFLEGDDFHSEFNIAKMSNGIALTNDDRMPWVDAMVEACRTESARFQQEGTPLILACSALSKAVRQRLRAGLHDQCRFIHLHGDHATLKERLSDRKGHFFKPELLASQFEALEIPQSATTLDIFQPIDVLTQQLYEIIQSENKA